MANMKKCNERQRKRKVQRGERMEGSLGRAGEAWARAESAGGGRQRRAKARGGRGHGAWGSAEKRPGSRQGARWRAHSRLPAAQRPGSVTRGRSPAQGPPHSPGLQASSSAGDSPAAPLLPESKPPSQPLSQLLTPPLATLACCDHSLTVYLPGMIGATLQAEPPAEPRAWQGADAHYGLN